MYEGKITRPVTIRESVLFTSIHLKGHSNPIQLVLFRKHRPTQVYETFVNLSVGDEIKVNGTVESNPMTGEHQIIVTNFGEDERIEAQVKNFLEIDGVRIYDDQEDYDEAINRLSF